MNFDTWWDEKGCEECTSETDAEIAYNAGLERAVEIITKLDETMYQSNTFYNALREAMENIRAEIDK